MAKVMVSIPDELLVQIDAEARRQGTTRSGLLQRAARAEIGMRSESRAELKARFEAMRGNWKHPQVESGERIRIDRRSH